MALSARLLLWAALPLAAWCLNFTSYGAKTGCRKTADGSDDCSEKDNGPCNDRYDVLVEKTLERCQAVCGILAKSCFGIEFLAGATGGRCEIWKVPIGRAAQTSDDHECFKHEDQSSDAEDGELVLQFQLWMEGASTRFFDSMSHDTALLKHFSDLVKNGMDGVLSKPGWNVSVNDISVAPVENSIPPRFSITIAPSRGVLQLYAYLRQDGWDFRDGTEEGGRAALLGSILEALEAAPWFEDFSGGRTVTPSISDRALKSPSPAPEPSPTPSQDETDGVQEAWRPLLALSIAAWVASTLHAAAL